MEPPTSPPPNNRNLSPAFELFGPSIALIRANPVPFVLISLLPSLLWLLVRYLAWDKQGNVLHPGLAAGGFGLLALYSLLTLAAAPYLQLRAAQGQRLNYGITLRQSFAYYWRLLALVIIIFVLVIFGLLLFIVPGVVALKRYILAPFVLIDKNSSVREAMATSSSLSRGHSLAILGIPVVIVAISLIGWAPVVGGLLANLLTFLYTPALALRYQELAALQPAELTPISPAGKK